MKRVVWLVGAGSLLGWGIFGALGGCGGADDPGITEDGGDEGSSGSSGTSGTSGTSGSTGDGGGDGGTSSGTLTSNPGKVTCGSAECDAGQNGSRCCIFEDAGTPPLCTTQGCGGNTDLELRCDEKADCQDQNDKCCLVGNDEARCENNCPGQGNEKVQICKTDQECPDAGKCTAKTCVRGPQTLKLNVCGTPTGCN